VPRPRLSRQFRQLIEQLDSHATDDLVRRVAGELAQAVSKMPDPGRSLGAYLRRFRERGISEAACDDVRAVVLQQLTPEVLPAASRGEIGAQEAARLTGQSLKTLLQQLKSPVYRRLYGWPIWRGNQWTFVREAVDPATSRQYLATLPDHEPAAIAALLPSWCARSPAIECEVPRADPRDGASE
jgi:hypothetical protein